MDIIWSLLSGIPGLLTGLLNYLNKRTDAQVEKLRIDRGVDRDTAIEIIKSDAAVKQSTANIIMAAMSHPVWWAAWLLFVIPVGVYEGMIFYVSTFDAWINAAGCVVPKLGELPAAGRKVCEWYVRRVPDEQEQLARLIVQSIFLAQAGTGAMAGISNAIATRLKR